MPVRFSFSFSLRPWSRARRRHCAGCSSAHSRPRQKSAIHGCTRSPCSPGARQRKTRFGSGSQERERGTSFAVHMQRVRAAGGALQRQHHARHKAASCRRPSPPLERLSPEGCALARARHMHKARACLVVPCACQGANGRRRASTVCDAPAPSRLPPGVCHRACVGLRPPTFLSPQQ